jgi:hypothetical protein
VVKKRLVFGLMALSLCGPAQARPEYPVSQIPACAEMLAQEDVAKFILRCCGCANEQQVAELVKANPELARRTLEMALADLASKKQAERDHQYDGLLWIWARALGLEEFKPRLLAGGVEDRPMVFMDGYALTSDIAGDLISVGNFQQSERLLSALEKEQPTLTPQQRLFVAKARMVSGRYLLARQQGEALVELARAQSNPQELLELYACLLDAGRMGGLPDITNRYLEPFQQAVAALPTEKQAFWRFYQGSFDELRRMEREPETSVDEFCRRYDRVWNNVKGANPFEVPLLGRIFGHLSTLWLARIGDLYLLKNIQEDSPEDKRMSVSLMSELNLLNGLTTALPKDDKKIPAYAAGMTFLALVNDVHEQTLRVGQPGLARQLMPVMIEVETGFVKIEPQIQAEQKEKDRVLRLFLGDRLGNFSCNLLEGDWSRQRTRMRLAQLQQLLAESKGKLNPAQARRAQKLADEAVSLNTRALRGIGYQGADDARWAVIEYQLRFRPPGWAKAAERLLLQLSETNQLLGYREGISRVAMLRGQLLAAQGQNPPAIQSLQQAVDDVEAYLAEVEAGEAGSRAIRDRYKQAYQLLAKLQLKSGKATGAFQTVSRQLQAEAVQQNQESLRNNTQLRDVNRVRAETAALEKQVADERMQGKDTQTSEQLLASSKGQYQRVVADLRRSHPQYEGAMAVRPVEFLELKKSIPADTTAVLYFVSDDGVYSFVASQQGDLKIHKVAVDPKELEKSVLRVRQLINLFPFDPNLAVGYARYFIIPTAWLVAYDCITLEQRRKMPRSYLDLAFVMVMAIDIAACLLDIWFINTHSYTGWFNNSDWDNRIAEIPLSMLWCLVCYLILRPFFHKKQFHALFTGLCALDIIVMANVVISFWGTVDMTTYMGGTASVDEETQIVEMLKDSENGQDYYRIKNESQTPAYINLNLREGYEGLGAFHSVYAYAAQDFIDRSRLPYYYHDWEMSSENRRYNLETFLGTKYYLVKKQSTNFGANSVPKYDYDIPLGYVNVLNLTDEEKASLGVNYSDKLLDYLASSDCNRSLYVNLYYVDLGFSFDTVINEDWLYYPYGDNGDWNRYEDVNEYPLLRYAMLENSDYQDFYSAKKLNAGTFVANGVSYTQQASTSSNKLGLSNQFLTDLVTVSPYEEGKTAPIEHLTGATRLKATVYSAKRVATSESPVYGDYVYAVVDGKNIFYDDTMVFDSSSNTKVLIPTLAQWRKDNPLLEANGVYPADTKYDYYTHLDDDGKTVSNAGKVTYFSKVVYTPVTTTTDSLGKVTTTPTTVCAKADPSDPTSGCYLSIDDTNNITWRLYDKDNKPIASAKHPYCSYKHAHGYYTDRPVATIIGIVQSGSLADPTSLRAPSIYVERHSDYVAAVNTLKKYQPTITYRSDDRIDFSTTTEQDRFMVLNYPNAKGWKVVENITSTSGKTTQSEVKTYTADGGFIGFITLSGTHSYSLIYESPYFKLGGAVTALGALITLAFLAYYGMKDKEARMEDKGTLKTVLKAELQKEAWQQDDYEK